MQITDGRGKHMTDLKETNKGIITKWFTDNPGTTATDCAAGTGLSYQTVLTHLKDLSEK